MAPGILVLVSIPCHIEPDVKFYLTRSGVLRQPSSWSIQDIHCPSFSVTGQIRSSRSMSISWLSSIVCAGVLVICLGVELALRQAPSLTSSLNLVEVETLPSWQVLLSPPCLGLRLIRTMVSCDFSPDLPQDFSSSVYTFGDSSCGLLTR